MFTRAHALPLGLCLIIVVSIVALPGCSRREQKQARVDTAPVVTARSSGGYATDQVAAGTQGATAASATLDTDRSAVYASAYASPAQPAQQASAAGYYGANQAGTYGNTAGGYDAAGSGTTYTGQTANAGNYGQAATDYAQTYGQSGGSYAAQQGGYANQAAGAYNQASSQAAGAYNQASSVYDAVGNPAGNSNYDASTYNPAGSYNNQYANQAADTANSYYNNGTQAAQQQFDNNQSVQAATRYAADSPRIESAVAAINYQGAQAAASQTVSSFGDSYQVVKGDTLSHIARTYGVSVRKLMALNNITDPRKLMVGQKLVIP